MKAGDVLVVIDPRDYDVAVAKAEADVADAESRSRKLRGQTFPSLPPIPRARSRLRNPPLADSHAGLLAAQRQFQAAQARLATAEAQVREAEANYKKAADDVARYKLLVDKDEISQQIYDQAAQTAAAAKATVATRIAAVNEARQNVTVAEAAVQQAQTKIPQADASIQSALTAPQQVAVSQSRAKSSEAQARAAGSAARPGQAQPELLHDRRAGRRNRRQEDRGSRPERLAGPAADGGGSAG